MPECFRLWLVRLKVITFHFLDWPFQSHLEVEVHTDHGEYYEETFKFNNILDPLPRLPVEFTMMKGMCLDRAV